MQDLTLVVSPECTLVYPSLFEPSSFKNEDPTFSATFLIPKSADLQPIREAVKAAAFGKWGTGISLSSIRMPVRDGDEKAIDENGNVNKDSFYYNQWFIRAKSRWQPSIVNIYNMAITDPQEIYGGCVVSALLSFYGYDYMGNKGVGCGLRAVCKIEDGEPIGSGRVNTGDVFKHLIQDAPTSPPGWEEEVRGGYGEMGGPMPTDKMPPDDIPF